MMEKISSKKRILRNDILLIGGILLGAALLGLCLILFRGEGTMVEVTIDGELYGRFSLGEERIEEIRTGEDQLNRLVIRGGEAFIEEANCPDGICAAHRPISHEGESIICLPHRVVASIVGEEAEDAPDMVA